MVDQPSIEPKTAPLTELLVVDDDAVLRETLSEVLEEAGYHVQTAVHGGDALARMQGGSLPDLILLDLLMPVMNGWDFMAELKAHPGLAAIPVVVTSAGGDHVLNSAPVCAGYLSKPLGRPRLLEIIARCLSLRHHAGRT